MNDIMAAAEEQIHGYVREWFAHQKKMLDKFPKEYEETTAQDMIDAFWEN